MRGKLKRSESLLWLFYKSKFIYYVNGCIYGISGARESCIG